MNTNAISPLRQRMIDDMNLRKLSPKTQQGYLRAVSRFAQFFGHSPHLATAENLRLFQLHLVNQGASNITINATIVGLRQLFNITLKTPQITEDLKALPKPQKLPSVLNKQDAGLMIQYAPNAKYRAMFATAYGAGLRVNEITHLKVADIDSQRMILHVHQGKGNKDRNAMLSDALLLNLRQWWQAGHKKYTFLPSDWLFPGQSIGHHVSNRQLNRICHETADRAGIKQRMSMHTLRHSFATHLLEQGVDIRVIQVLLGHSQLNITARYANVATKMIRQVISPLDALNLTD